jgi:UDP-N-acetylglucosamine diphosphorylase / glucose-1-phosphate thymidylyltransferase / UDP-N-acetylgalactosamine diphosphorylase / glucosamine-1-phosphate N-acetyltransferase / galactosamine-1-phosphate N-acetyltransferase
MPAFSLILFDDVVAREWEPFALTRPVGELLYGALTFRERAERVFGGPCVAHVGAEHLLGFEEQGAPPVASGAESFTTGSRLFWLSRAVPAWDARASWRIPDRSGPVELAGQAVGWFSAPGEPPPPAEFLLDPRSSTPTPTVVASVEGSLLERVWEMVPRSHEQAALDIEALHGSRGPTELPAGVHQWGRYPLIVGKGAQLEPGCALDTSEGPIWLDDGAAVRAFTRLSGPSYIGRGSTILGGPVGPISMGPICRIRGEIAESVCLGYTNKQHDGHIGHAYLGRWVNLGAETTNSDLKNNYGSIRLWTPQGEQDTGAIKMGCLLGDHVKTGIGLLLNTGTVVGAGSNLWGAVLPPRFVPPFSWGSGNELTEYRLDKFLEVAERAMGRRNVPLAEATRAQLGLAWERSRQWRRT